MGSGLAGAVSGLRAPRVRRIAVLLGICLLAGAAFSATALARVTPPRVPACFSHVGICDGVALKSEIGATKLRQAQHGGIYKLTGPAPLQTQDPVACGDEGCIYNHLDWGVGDGGVVKKGCQTNETTCEVAVPLGSDAWVPVVVTQNDYPEALFLLWTPPCDAGDASGAAVGNPLDARIALNNFCNDRGAAYYAQTALNGTVGLFGVVVSGLSLYGGYAAAVSTSPTAIGPLAALGLAGIGVATGQSITNSANNAQHDPPDRHFRSVASVPHVPGTGFRAQRGISKRALRALKSYGAALLQAGAVSSALATTINRGGGAIDAHRPLWEGRQMSHAIVLCHTLVAALNKAIAAAGALKHAAPGSRALTTPVTASDLRLVQLGVARYGVSPALAKAVRKYGGSAAGLRSALTSALPANPPHDLLDAAAGPQMIRALKQTAKAMRLYSRVPQVVKESKLR